MPEAEFEPARALEALDRHGVGYVLVGGLGARAHGATRPTGDIDLVPDGDDDNLARLAAALLELNAPLRVGGMTDDEARQLPVQLDAETLRSFGSSTWMTDAGPIDVLRDLRDRQGGDVAFDELITRVVDQQIGAVVVHVAALDDIVASKEHADREKDREALPELRNLNRER